jgi:two-component sensor histidine kinase
MIHELTTNAIKYGALSCPEGQVHVECRILDQNGRSQFQLVWNEMGGPTVSPPTRKGFGSAILVELAKSFAENVQINYAPGGLVYEIQLPLSAIEPPQAQVLTSPTATAGA